jgi:uncharacterized protein
MMSNYDVIIIGAGVSGLFTAIKLARSPKKILLIDIGKDLPHRLSALGTDIASNRSQDRYFGFGGLGLSEGKYNYTNDFGGELAHKIGAKESWLYQQQVDQLLCQYGADKRECYHIYDAELAKKAARLGFTLLSTHTRHLGTRLSCSVCQQIFSYLNQHIDILCNTQVTSITPNNRHFLLTLSDQRTIMSRNVVIAVGRQGMDWLDSIASSLGLTSGQVRLDLGFRIEMAGHQLAPLLQKSREVKLNYTTPDFSATTYCMNPKGRVVAKHQQGLVMPEGQNCLEQGDSHNLNFSLFIPKWFASRTQADSYLAKIIGHINQQQGRILAQRLVDINAYFQPQAATITPSLASAEFGELWQWVPNECLHYTNQFLVQLQQLLAQPIDGNTILYAMDSKTYAPIIDTDRYFATAIDNLYLIGDCSGVTSSLSQAAASGLYMADILS